jgi:hypothetical protein
MIRSARLLAAFTTLMVAAATVLAPPADAQDYGVSWLANTFPGISTQKDANGNYTVPGVWAPNDVDGMLVMPDGTVYTNSVYDEGQRDANIWVAGYVDTNALGKDGGLGKFQDTHGYGRAGGSAVSSDGTYVYLAMQQAYQSPGGGGYPADPGDIWYVIRRYDLNGNPSPFAAANGLNGVDGSMLIINQTKEMMATVNSQTTITFPSIGTNILAAAVVNSYLYVVDRHMTLSGSNEVLTSTLRAFHLPDMTEDTGQATALSNPYELYVSMAAKSDGTLWLSGTAFSDGTGSCIRQGTGPQISQITPHVGAQATSVTVPIAGLYDPQAIAFDNSTPSNLIIADNANPLPYGPTPSVPNGCIPSPPAAHHQIFFYNVSNLSSPTLINTFGQAGGVLGGSTPGAYAANAFQGITGVGMDSSGNLVVAFNGNGKLITYPNSTDPRHTNYPGAFSPIPSSGALGINYVGRPMQAGGDFQFNLRFFQPSGASYVLNGSYTYPATPSIQSKAFTSSADVDPGSESDVYTSRDHFQYTYEANDPVPTTPQWTTVSTTLNANAYPNDPRVWIKQVDFGGIAMRRVSNHLLMYLFSDGDGQLAIYRFSNGIAVPSGMINFQAPFDTLNSTSYFPPNQPQATTRTNPWTWLDSNGDGNFQTGEFSQAKTTTFCAGCGHMTGNSVDDQGNIWVVIDGYQGDQLGNQILEFKLESFDSNGNPVYDTWDTASQFPIPLITGSDPTPIGTQSGSTCTLVTPTHDLYIADRVLYQPDTDMMFLIGFTNHDMAYYCGEADTNSAGPTMVAYSNWLRSRSNPGTYPLTVAWKKPLLWDILKPNKNVPYFSYPESVDIAYNPTYNAANPGVRPARLFVSYGEEDVTTNGSSNGGDTLVFDATTGNQVDDMRRGTTTGNVGQFFGDLVDFPWASTAYQLSNGQYVLFQEEVQRAKVVTYLSPLTP